ncbi:MAG: ferritin-like domain-containing protein [Candidatus Thermoplasmatota archaeon]|nr:ferritin-like domain-containing protein [Candidatus Thermoplasmatota archaeon]
MGIKGRETSVKDAEELIKLLNEALSEEWLAYYQYWIGAKVMEGPMRSEIEPELLIHANQELNHANLVADRIVQLGGTPVLDPSEWIKLGKCAYEAPDDPYVEAVLEQNLRGERCAIDRYQSLANLTSGKDHTTHQMVVTILSEEIEHEQEIEDWLLDIDRMRQDLIKLRT